MLHAPGKWTVTRPFRAYFVESESGVRIAEVITRDERGSSIYDGAETKANADLLASAPDLLAQVAALEAERAKDAALIAELVAAASVQCHCGSNAAHEAAQAVIAKYAAESRAEAKCEWCDSGNVAPMSRIPSWPGRPLHEVGDGEYVACKRSSSTPAAAAESRAEAGREKESQQ